jgi:Fe-S-cluster containining protein
LDEEVQNLIDADIQCGDSTFYSPYKTLDKRIRAVSNPSGEGFICSFLNLNDNKCKIYARRPFECQLYPFLINLKGKRIILNLDLNCQYLKEKLNEGAGRFSSTLYPEDPERNEREGGSHEIPRLFGLGDDQWEKNAKNLLTGQFKEYIEYLVTSLKENPQLLQAYANHGLAASEEVFEIIELSDET